VALFAIPRKTDPEETPARDLFLGKKRAEKGPGGVFGGGGGSLGGHRVDGALKEGIPPVTDSLLELGGPWRGWDKLYRPQREKEARRFKGGGEAPKRRGRGGGRGKTGNAANRKPARDLSHNKRKDFVRRGDDRRLPAHSSLGREEKKARLIDERESLGSGKG